MPRAPRHSLPYVVHTNRELGMMLRGTKPLAVFNDGEGYFPEALLRYLRMFDRHVAAGRLVRRDQFLPYEGPVPGVERWHRIYFALPGEEWRIDAMIALRARLGEWTRACEYEQGQLFGYEEWQNDIWLTRMYG